MRTLLLTALGLASVAALADKTPKTVRCAVMPLGKISVAEATKDKMFADYKGRRYFFCCAGCPEEFKANPAKFAKTADSIPTPNIAKPKKKS